MVLSTVFARPRRLAVVGLASLALAVPAAGLGQSLAQAAPVDVSTQAAAAAAFGPNVTVFDPSMSTASIQAKLNAVNNAQVNAEFGAGRYTFLFTPGVYGSAAAPLNIPLGYYTTVAGLGKSPDDTVINGTVYIRNRCVGNGCFALTNFWRSITNFRINIAPGPNDTCIPNQMIFAVSQAAPMRRMHIVGEMALSDVCSEPHYASGGFIADSRLGTVRNYSQQQWLTRNSELGLWDGGVWNQVFSGVAGAPAPCFPQTAGCGPFTVRDTSPVTKEVPFLYLDGGKFNVWVPAARTNSRGVSWASGLGQGKAYPLSKFLVVRPGTSVADMNAAMRRNTNLLFTPGIYNLGESIVIDRPNGVVMGMGMATLRPTNGNSVIQAQDPRGANISSLLVDAGVQNSAVLMRIGKAQNNVGVAENPASLHDVFFRIGGAGVGRASLSLQVNSDYTILDHIWAWRADHGTGFGWNVNTATTGVEVNGGNVTAYGLFVEHYQGNQVNWNGNGGRVVMFQNEMPYDPPSQAAWQSGNGEKGHPALRVAANVKTFSGIGMGSYTFFNQGVDIRAENAFEVPRTLAPGSLKNLTTVFLDGGAGNGGTNHVVNGVGPSALETSPGGPSTAQVLASYP